jgi:peptide deformylase
VARCDQPRVVHRTTAQMLRYAQHDCEIMAILRVARLGHPVLRQRASDVEPADIRAGKFRQLVEDMIETMHEYQGVGLAAPQVHLPLRIFVFEVQEQVAQRRGVNSLPVGVFFNASLHYLGDEKVTDYEGCLSVPLLSGEVPRYSRLVLRGIDPMGQAAEVEAEGFTARIFQHEVDHTEGHVYLDRMPDLRSLAYTILL